MRLLLFSNSTNAGEEYLSYTLPYIHDFVGKEKQQAVFIPFAGISVGFDNYAKMVSDKMMKLGIIINTLHTERNKEAALKKADLIITGGGNTFYLLAYLQKEKLLGAIKE